MKEFEDARKRTEKEITRVMELPEDTVSPIPEAAGRGVLVSVIPLTNPYFYTEEHVIHVPDRVYVTSAFELVKDLQLRYHSEGNNFAGIARKVMETGNLSLLNQIERLNTDEMRLELGRASTIIRSLKTDSLVVLSGLDPISLVGEYEEDGAHVSEKPLRTITFPCVIEANEATLKFTSAGGVRVTDGRKEKNANFTMNRFSAEIGGSESNIAEVRKGVKVPYFDTLVEGLAGLLTIVGLLGMLATRLRLWEYALIPLILGVVLLVFRYGPWGAAYFSDKIVDIAGESVMKVNFYGELR